MVDIVMQAALDEWVAYIHIVMSSHKTVVA